MRRPALYNPREANPDGVCRAHVVTENEYIPDRNLIIHIPDIALPDVNNKIMLKNNFLFYINLLVINHNQHIRDR